MKNLKLFASGVALQALWVIILLAAGKLTESTHAISIITSVALIAAYTTYKFNTDGTMNGRKGLIACFGVVAVLILTIWKIL